MRDSNPTNDPRRVKREERGKGEPYTHAHYLEDSQAADDFLYGVKPEDVITPFVLAIADNIRPPSKCYIFLSKHLSPLGGKGRDFRT